MLSLGVAVASILPFRGIRYNKEKIGDFFTVLTPPYDVISKEDQERFYSLSPYNIIRIILGKDREGDNTRENKYTRARDYLKEWLKEEVFITDPLPSIYIYSLEFCWEERLFERVGFICLLKLEEFGKGIVYPHEHTLPEPKEDRMRLLRNCLSHTEPIFCLYEDEGKRIKERILDGMKRKPEVDVGYEGRQRHRLWIMSEPSLIKEITELMEEKPVYIADGHHRYEVALSFSKEFSYNYIMVYMVDMNDKGLLILPAHRAVKEISEKKKRRMIERIDRYFKKEDVSSLDALIRRLNALKGRHVFGMYEGGKHTLLLLKEKKRLEEMKDISPSLRELDVIILHNLILETEGKEAEGKIIYTTSTLEAKEMVDKGECRVAFFLNPTKVEDIKKVAHLGECMPGKATYFYPKPLSGLVLHKF
jgi:uncharacterized protein (DUF1015 family)